MNPGHPGAPADSGVERSSSPFLWWPGDPVLLVGSDHRLLALNQAAGERIPALSGAAAGTPLQQLWPALEARLATLASGLGEGPLECAVERDAELLRCRLVAIAAGFAVVLLPPEPQPALAGGPAQILAGLLEANPDPLLLLSGERLEPEGPVILWSNAAARALTGLAAPALAGLHPVQLLGPEIPPAELQRFQLALASTRAELFDAPIRHHGGGTLVAEVRTTPVQGSGGCGSHALLTLRDVAELRASEEQVLAQAFTDPLTGLPNRRAFSTRLAQAVERIERSPSQLAVLVIDIDGFRELSAELGPEAGDRLLLEATRRLQLALRGGDVLARSGIDVFLLLAEHVGNDGDAYLLGERLRRCMAQPWQDRGEPLALTVSCGVATSGRQGVSGPELLDAAESAVKRVKQDGGDGVFLHERPLGEESEADDNLSLRQQLQMAIRMGGLFFEYQPLVNIGTGRVLGAEALVRVREEGGQVLPPEAFIPMANRTGQIRTIDRWVLTEAMNTVRRWRRTGRNLGLAINLSSSRLEAGTLIGDLVREAKRTGVSPAGLTLEISEQQLYQLKERAAPLLQALRKVGVSIALDDFGTGQGSLEWLLSLPIDQVKIDASYVSAMVHDSRCHDLLRSFVRVFLERRLDVVAEGIETLRQREMLLAMGCRRGQGWLFGRPGPIEVLETAAFRAPGSTRPLAGR